MDSTDKLADLLTTVLSRLDTIEQKQFQQPQAQPSKPSEPEVNHQFAVIRQATPRRSPERLIETRTQEAVSYVRTFTG